MRGMLLMDLYTLKNQKRMFFPLLIAGVLIGVLSDAPIIMSFILTVGLISALFSLFSYDEAAKWYRYAIAMPVRRSGIVLARYLTVFITLAASCVLQFATFGALALVKKQVGWLLPALTVIGGIAALFLIVSSVIIPATIRLGTEKARYVMTAAVLIPNFALLFFNEQAEIWLGNIAQSNILLPVVVLGAVLVVLVFSYILSLHFLRGKEY